MADDTRVDERGRAYKGSQLQMQIYVNRRRDELNQAVCESLPALADAEVSWVAPLEADGFVEPRDSAFLAAVEQSRLADNLATFWPKGGPVWDGLAAVRIEGSPAGVLLVEGKAYPGEMKSSCSATDPDSLSMIENALAATRDALAFDGDNSQWMFGYYQLANRLAHMVWLRRQGVPAWLVFLLFTDDVGHVATSEEEWRSSIADVESALGVSLLTRDDVAHVLLPARPRSDLAP